MPNSVDQNADIERNLAELMRASIQQLRDRWHAGFRIEPPVAFGPDLLRRSIAQRIQEEHYGGLSASVQRQLSQIVKAMASNPGRRIELPRRIKSGAVLVRTWKDKSHRVTVLDEGFIFEGRPYTKPLGDRAGNHRHPMERSKVFRSSSNKTDRAGEGE